MGWRVGGKGERIAEEYLRGKGYRILQKHYKKSYGEIDIIAEDNKQIVFVEVKSTEGYGGILERIDEGKIGRIRRLAEECLELDYNGPDKEVRFDVILVRIRGRQSKLEHLEDAF